MPKSKITGRGAITVLAMGTRQQSVESGSFHTFGGSRVQWQGIAGVRWSPRLQYCAQRLEFGIHEPARTVVAIKKNLLF